MTNDNDDALVFILIGAVFFAAALVILVVSW